MKLTGQSHRKGPQRVKSAYHQNTEKNLSPQLKLWERPLRHEFRAVKDGYLKKRDWRNGQAAFSPMYQQGYTSFEVVSETTAVQCLTSRLDEKREFRK